MAGRRDNAIRNSVKILKLNQCRKMGIFNTAFKFPDHSINVAVKPCCFKATENERCADMYVAKKVSAVEPFLSSTLE